MKTVNSQTAQLFARDIETQQNNLHANKRDKMKHWTSIQGGVNGNKENLPTVKN